MDAPFGQEWATNPDALMAWYVEAELITPEGLEMFKAAWTLWQMEG